MATIEALDLSTAAPKRKGNGHHHGLDQLREALNSDKSALARQIADLNAWLNDTVALVVQMSGRLAVIDPAVERLSGQMAVIDRRTARARRRIARIADVIESV